MTNLAVRKYSTVAANDKPSGIPDEWPYHVLELGEGMTLPNGNYVLMTVAEYNTHISNNQSAYNTWKAGVDSAEAPIKNIESKLEAAKRFGSALMTEFATSNVIAGYTTAQVKQIADHMQNIQLYLQSGSLYVALNAIENLAPIETILPQSKIDAYKLKIQKFLELA